MKTVHALLIFSVLAVALAQGYYQRPLHLDVLESLRQAQHLQQTGLPVDNANALVGNSHYPPIFSILLTEWSALTGLSLEDAETSLAYFTTMALLLAVIAFSQPYLGSLSAAVLAAFLFLLMPWPFYRMAYPVSETLGLMGLVLALHAFSKKQSTAALILLTALPLVHFRSAAVAFIAVAVLGGIEGRWKETAKALLPGGLVYLLTAPKGALGLVNPFVTLPNALEITGALPAALGILGLTVMLLHKERPANVHVALLIAIALSGLLAPFPLRQVLFVTPLLALWGARLIQSVPKAVPAALVLGALIVAANIPLRTAPYTQVQKEAAMGLQQMPGSVVFADYSDNYLIPYFSGKKVVAGPYLEEVGDGKERLALLQGYFIQRQPGTLALVKSEYGATLAVLAAQAVISENEMSAKAFDNGKYAIYSIN